MHGKHEVHCFLWMLTELVPQIGCFISIGFGLPLGRKRSVILGTFFITVGGILQASAFNVAQLYAGRVIAGCGTGLTSSAIPIWVSECTGAGSRGRHIAIQLAIVTSGTVVAYWLDYGMLLHYSGDVVFRFPLAFQCFYSVAGGLLVCLLPESPRLLYKKQKIQEADDVLLRLLDAKDSDVEFIEQRRSILENIAVEDAEDTQAVWRGILWDSSPLRNTRRFWTVVTMQMLQQMGGINAVACTSLSPNSAAPDEKLTSTPPIRLRVHHPTFVYWLGGKHGFSVGCKRRLFF